MCSIALDEAQARAPLRNHLKSAEVETRPFFHPAHTLPPYDTKASLPVAESLSARGINLPSYPALSEAEVSEICTLIHQFFQHERP
jgi:perosamine synthetase